MKRKMTALFTSSKTLDRPGGVRAIAFACFGLAIYLVVSAALVTAEVLSFASTRYVLGDYATMGPMLYVIVAFALGCLGLGLLKRLGPMRRLAIVAAGFFLATSLLPISAAVSYFQIVPLIVHGTKVVLAIMAIRYLLLGEVVEWFSARSGR